MKTLSRRKALTVVAAAPAAVAFGAGTTLHAEEGGDLELRRLWGAWCAQLVAVRETNGIAPLCSDPSVVRPETAKLRALEKLIFETPAVGATTVCLKLAFWRYGRYMSGHPRDNRLVISIYREFASASAVDFDAIAQSHGLEARDWDTEARS